MIIGVVAVDSKWSIGKTNPTTGKGQLLFRLKKDMEFFRMSTEQGGIVVFGENTYLSLPKRPLANRVNVVLCPEGHDYEGCICIHTFDELLNFVKVMAKRFDVYICGGAMLYSAMLPYYDSVVVTKVESDGGGTVFFPNLDDNQNFNLTLATNKMIDNGHTIQFCLYERQSIDE